MNYHPHYLARMQIIGLSKTGIWKAAKKNSNVLTELKCILKKAAYAIANHYLVVTATTEEDLL